MSLPRYIVLDSSAKMPSSCKGEYRRIAILELDGSGVQPKMISERANGCKRIVQTWEALSVGKTARSAFARAMVEAEAECARLNEE